MLPKKMKPKEGLNILHLMKSFPSPPLDPLFIKMPSFAIIKSELRYAASHFQRMRMFESAKWLSELLNSVTDFHSDMSPEMQEFLINNSDAEAQSFCANFPEEDSMAEVEDALLQIRALFDLREYKRCAFTAEKFLKRFPGNQTILFFKVYSTFLKEKLKAEEEKADKQLDSFLIRKFWTEVIVE